jgi:peptidyl-prolyl cis-trans isomerase SurA
MKRLLWVIPAIMLGFNAVGAEVIDRILAKVNDDIITLSELNREMDRIRVELEAKYTGQQLKEAIQHWEQQILDRLIEDKLLHQKAVEIGYDANVDSARISAAVQQVMKDNNIEDTDELDLRLSQQGMTLSDLRDQIRDQLMVSDLVNSFVRSRIALLTPEIEKYYKDHAEDFTSPEEVSLSEIIIASEGDDKEAENRAADLYGRLQKGESFATLASQYSKGPTANKGGSIGTYMVSTLKPETVETIKGLKEGNISPPSKIAEGYVIYRVDSRSPTTVKPLDEVRDEIKGRLYASKFNPEYERFISQLREEAYIQIYSEAQ